MTDKIIMDICVALANNSHCVRSKCGSIVMNTDGHIIGVGWNSKPHCHTYQDCIKDSLPQDFKSDKTCCVHAEQRAIMDALTKGREQLFGGSIYFVRLDEKGFAKPSGHPYCTICSKMAYDVGLDWFHLWGVDRFTRYDTETYNKLSFQHHLIK